MKNYPILPGFLFFLLLLLSCSSDQGKQGASISYDELDTKSVQSAKDLFYNMFLPCELVFLFDREDVSYHPSLMNPATRVEDYITLGKKALNLGIYGVDMGYMKFYDENFGLKGYYTAISKLSREIGIPDEYVMTAVGLLEEHMYHEDSLYQASCELLEVTDLYLTSNEQQAMAALIILGGWIEAMYITLHLDEEPSQEMMDRIAAQKFGLKSLISYLNMYQDDFQIIQHTLSLNRLWKVFDQIEVYFEDENLQVVDTLKRTIDTSLSKSNISLAQFKEIKKMVTRIRQGFVSASV